MWRALQGKRFGSKEGVIMIAVTLDMSQASTEEIEVFHATPGVALAVDGWAHTDESVQMKLHEPHELTLCQTPVEPSH